MAAARNVNLVIGDGLRTLRDEENGTGKAREGEESPTAKRFKSDRFPLTRWEFAAFFAVFMLFSSGLFCVYLTMPPAEFGKLKLPRTVSDLRSLRYVTVFS